MLNEELRYGTVRHQYTKWQRVSLWFRGIIDAINTPPEKEWTQWIILRPGDDGYEDAPFGCVVDQNAPRYRFENGEFVQVHLSEEPKPPNPNWHTP